MNNEINEPEGDIWDKIIGAELCVISSIVVILIGAYAGGYFLAWLGV